MGTKWRPLRGVDSRRLRDARMQAHHAVQWLARAARAYVPPQPDDGHTSLGWLDGHDSFVTHPMPGGWRLSLHIPKLTLALLSNEGDTAAESLPLDDRTDAQVRSWLGNHVTACGFDPKALDAPSPYATPARPLGNGAAYDAVRLAEPLAELATWFANGAISLAPVAQTMAPKLMASPLRCWPHHFDLATLLSFPSKAADTTAYVGAGIEPGDEYYDEPYFYVTVHPRPDPATLPPLPGPGHWHGKDFVAAIVTSDKLLASKSPQMAAEEFLHTAIACAFDVLR